MDLDEAALVTAMRQYVSAYDALADTGGEGEARTLVDLAEVKTVAAMQLRKALLSRGWVAPVRQSS